MPSSVMLHPSTCLIQDSCSQFSWVSLNKVVLWGYFLPLWTSIFRNGFPSWWQLWLLGFEERFVPSHFTRLRPQQEPLLRTAELQVANWLPQVLPLLSLCFINVIESGSRASRLLSFSSLPYCLSFFFFAFGPWLTFQFKSVFSSLCRLLEGSRLLCLFEVLAIH